MRIEQTMAVITGASGGIGAAVGIWWFVSAKNWFHGPKVQGTREELLAIERELSELS